MTYTAAAVLGVARRARVDLLVLRTRLRDPGRVLGHVPDRRSVFSCCRNGILTGRRIVIYDPAAIIGWRLVSRRSRTCCSASRWCC